MSQSGPVAATVGPWQPPAHPLPVIPLPFQTKDERGTWSRRRNNEGWQQGPGWLPIREDRNGDGHERPSPAGRGGRGIKSYRDFQGLLSSPRTAVT